MSTSPRCILGTAVLMLICLSGCQTTPSTAERSSPPQKPTGTRLAISGDSVVLGDVSAPPMTVETFERRLLGMLQKGKRRSAADWADHHEDMMRAMVLAPAGRNRAAVDFAARRLDQTAQGKGGWHALLADRKSRSSHYAAYDRQQTRWWDHARRGRFAQAASTVLNPPADAPAPWLRVEANRLSAVALIASGRAEQAAELFASAAALAAPWDRQDARRFGLLASLTHQQGGQAAQAQAAWQSVVSDLDIERVNDPMLLQLIARLHPDLASTTGDQALLRRAHSRLGQLHLVRGQPQAALLAWRAAERAPGASPSTDTLRLQQADALLAMNQRTPAVSMLIGLTESSHRAKALARLGVVNLKAGRVEMGLGMLSKATETASVETDPEIHADYGLALLAVGENEKGQERLDQARERFEAAGDHSAVRRLLANELAFATATSDHSRAAQIENRLNQLEQ